MMADDEPDDVRRHNVSEGVKVTAKLKRGTDTRDQDVIRIEARGETADEAAEEFEALLSHASASGWDDRLRAMQPEAEGGDADGE